MSLEYHLADGKTQAFFGIQHLDRLYYGALGFLGLIISIVAIWKNEKKGISVFALIFSVISILLTYMELWEYLI